MKNEVYHSSYVKNQIEKFRNRHNNHFANHIRLVKELVAKYSANSPDEVLLDIGCSIGTFALEFAVAGYKTIGLDIDKQSLDCGKKLALELNCNPDWICADATDFQLEKKADIVICFDLFEHLRDDEISLMLKCVHAHLKENGILVFHTFPTEFNHIFYTNNFICIPLLPFKNLPEEKFEKLVKLYAFFCNIFYLLRYLKPYKFFLSFTPHPNPLSKKRLQKLLQDAGFKILLMDTKLDEINPLRGNRGKIAKKYFSHQSITLRSIYGVAGKKCD